MTGLSTSGSFMAMPVSSFHQAWTPPCASHWRQITWIPHSHSPFYSLNGWECCLHYPSNHSSLCAHPTPHADHCFTTPTIRITELQNGRSLGLSRRYRHHASTSLQVPSPCFCSITLQILSFQPKASFHVGLEVWAVNSSDFCYLWRPSTVDHTGTRWKMHSLCCLLPNAA